MPQEYSFQVVVRQVTGIKKTRKIESGGLNSSWNYMFLFVVLVILKASEPGGPVVRPGAAGFRPRTGCDVRAIPFQRPQLLESHISYGPIHEKEINEAVVPVDAEMIHFARRALITYPESIHILRRIIGVTRPGIVPGGIAEHRYRIRTNRFAFGLSGIGYYGCIVLSISPEPFK
jgi:hypothetical protein